jgi:prophage regulatory protein
MPVNDAAAEAIGPSTEEELWKLKTVTARTGLFRSTLYNYVKQDLFPRQRRLGRRRVGWRASEVRAWIASRPR